MNPSILISLYSLASIFYLFPAKCNTAAAYKYNVIQKSFQGGQLVLESPSTSFVSFNDSLFEYEIATVERKEFDVDGLEVSNIRTYDTLGIYLLSPMQDKYFRISSEAGRSKVIDMGSIEQKMFGLSFKNAQPKDKEVIDPFHSRDTVIDGIKLKMYEKIDIKDSSLDTLVIRYYFFDSISVRSVLTYVTAKRFTEENDIFRVEINSRNDNYLYTVSISNLEKLSEIEGAYFRKLLKLLDK